MPRSRGADSQRNELAATAASTTTKLRADRESRARRGVTRRRRRDHRQLAAVRQPGDEVPAADRGRRSSSRRRSRSGDLAAKERLINSNLRLVIKFARRYQGLGLPMGDLIQEAMLGLIRAAEKFDWRRGYKFSTYAVLWIRQSIQRGLDNTGRPGADPRPRRPARADHEPGHGRADEGAEPRADRRRGCQEGELPLDEVMAMRDLTRVTTSLDAPVGEGDSTLGELQAAELRGPRGGGARARAGAGGRRRAGRAAR